MKKFNKLFAAGLATLFVTSCAEPVETPVVVENRVTFSENYVGGQDFETVSVQNGETVSRPATNPTRDGYVFDNWYDTAEADFFYDFSTPVTKDTTIYANWFRSATVNFYNNNAVYETQNVALGRKATPAKAPVDPASTFTGWYVDPACTTRYDFRAPVTGAFNLFAGWTQEGWSEADLQLMHTFLNGMEVPFIDLDGVMSSSTVQVRSMDGDDLIWISNADYGNSTFADEYTAILTAEGFEAYAPGEYFEDAGIAFVTNPETYDELIIQWWYTPATDEYLAESNIVAYIEPASTEFPVEDLYTYFGIDIPNMGHVSAYSAYDLMDNSRYNAFAVIGNGVEKDTVEEYAAKYEDAGWEIYGLTETEFGATKENDDGELISVSCNYFDDDDALQIMVRFGSEWDEVVEFVWGYFTRVGSFPQLEGIYEVSYSSPLSMFDFAEGDYVIVDVNYYGGQEAFLAYLNRLATASTGRTQHYIYAGASDAYYAEYGLIAYTFVSNTTSTYKTMSLEVYYYPEYESVRLIFSELDTSASRTSVDRDLIEYFGLNLTYYIGKSSSLFVVENNFPISYRVDCYLPYSDELISNANDLLEQGFDLVDLELDDAGNVVYVRLEEPLTAENAAYPRLSVQMLQENANVFTMYLSFVFTPASAELMVNAVLGIDSFVNYEDDIWLDQTQAYIDYDYISFGVLFVDELTDDSKAAQKYAYQLLDLGWHVEMEDRNMFYAVSPNEEVELEWYWEGGLLEILVMPTGHKYAETWEEAVEYLSNNFGQNLNLPEPLTADTEEGYYVDSYYYEENVYAVVFGGDVEEYADQLLDAGYLGGWDEAEGSYVFVAPTGTYEIYVYGSSALYYIDIYAASYWMPGCLNAIFDYLLVRWYGLEAGFEFEMPVVDGYEPQIVQAPDSYYYSYRYAAEIYVPGLTEEAYIAACAASGAQAEWDDYYEVYIASWTIEYAGDSWTVELDFYAYDGGLLIGVYFI